MTVSFAFLMAVLGFLAAAAVLVYHAVSAVAWAVAKVLKGSGKVLGHSLGFVRREAVDAVHTAGALMTGAVNTPLAVGNLAIGRLESARHYGKALRSELGSGARGLYRLIFANPLRFVGLGKAVDHLEMQMPELVYSAAHSSHARISQPRARNMVEPPPLRGRAARRTPKRGPVRNRPAVHSVAPGGEFEFEFEGYDVISELPPGGSGARLFVARPQPATAARLRESGADSVGQVVIKSFAISAGSTLQQIVREGRALEAARKVGFVLQHELDEERFWYVMPYVRGRELGDVSTAMHVRCGADGLDNNCLHKVASYTLDVLNSLEQFHAEGLWHKDVKPSNIIVSQEAAHLVDLGLVTPLSSAMTLTTHGTEFYRDPELVRQALRGAKVNEIDGVKFDLYAMGGVLYSMVENSFPAHGNLSRLTKRCPEALAFIVRRAMADLEDRYSDANEMREDLEVFLAASDPFAVLPVHLPSFQRVMQEEDEDAVQARRSRRAPLAEASPRTLRTPAPKGNSRMSAAPPLERGRNARKPRPQETADRDAAPRTRRRSHMGLATFALMFAAVLSVAKIIPAIVDGAEPHAFEEASRVEQMQFDQRMQNESIAAEEALVHQAAAQLEAEELVIAHWMAEVEPLVEHVDEGLLPEWSRGAQVLLLTDVLDRDEMMPMDPLAALLEESGFGVIGSSVNRSDTDSAVDLEAKARRALALASTFSDEALADLRKFIDATPELDAILWVAHDESGDGPSSRLVLPSHAPAWEGVSNEPTDTVHTGEAASDEAKAFAEVTFYGDGR
ncbi:MAG: serine/threonine protein kinase [Planctomycetota bacterium]|jgi:serine/threonine protein kinase